MSRPLFARRTARVLVWVGGVSFAVTLFFLVFGDRGAGGEVSWRADAFSRSALGYHALAGLLAEEVPVLVSRHDPLARAAPGRLLLLLEPPAGGASPGAWRENPLPPGARAQTSEIASRNRSWPVAFSIFSPNSADANWLRSEQQAGGDFPTRLPGHLGEVVEGTLAREASLVVVLPKWRGAPMPGRPSWVGEVELLPSAVPGEVLAAVLAAAGAKPATAVNGDAVLRPDGSPGGDSPAGDAAPGGEWRWHLSGERAVPDLAAPQLLRRRPGLEPLVATDAGLLVARLAATSLYLVADPDLFNTHGLGRGENALLAHRFLLEHLAPRTVIVDETLHGYRPSGSVWRALVEPPLLPFTLHLAALAALAVWAGSRRFGRPRELPPRLLPGKWTLVGNTVRLLGLAEHRRRSLEHYFRLTVGRAAARLGPVARLGPTAGRPRDQVAALTRLGRDRGLDLDLGELDRAVARLPAAAEPRRVLALARALYRWRKEIVDGTCSPPPAR